MEAWNFMDVLSGTLVRKLGMTLCLSQLAYTGNWLHWIKIMILVNRFLERQLQKKSSAISPIWLVSPPRYWTKYRKLQDMKIRNYQRNETFQRAYYKECMKNEHPNIFICPDKGMFKIPTSTIQNNVRILRSISATDEKTSPYRAWLRLKCPTGLLACWL